jgi:ATP-dependent RNA helicase RhlB
MTDRPSEGAATVETPPEPARLRFDELSLPDAVREGIRAAGFEYCTGIQGKVLPLSLAGKDVAGQAQTGTGKTAAFLITLFTRLLENDVERQAGQPRALVIAPTRELVVQIQNDATVLGVAAPFKVHAVYGGVDYQKQRTTLTGEVDVLIGTPGRLIDYLKQGVYDLRAVEVLVIDEADRMFDMGFIRDLRFLLRRLPHYRKRQSMLFSATLSWSVMELAYEHMNEPVRVSDKPDTLAADRIEHLVYHVGNHEKLSFLVGLMRREAGERVMIFTNMKRTAERLEADLAANGFAATALTGDVDQRRRFKLLEDFREGTVPILIATDVASRGLHIDGVTEVVNYDLPQDPEDYVHRVGRTARAGASGRAFSLACEDYVESLPAVEKLLGFKLPHAVPAEDLFVTDVKRAPREHRSRGFAGRGRPPPGRGRGGGGGGRRR